MQKMLISAAYTVTHYNDGNQKNINKKDDGFFQDSLSHLILSGM